MPQRKRKLRSKTLPVLGAAGLSSSLATNATASTAGMNPNRASQQVMLHEKEIADVSLATFHVFDKEKGPVQRPRARLAMGVGGCGCAGCGCACGIGLYYHYTPPVLGEPEPVYPPPLPGPIRPAHKYKSHHWIR